MKTRTFILYLLQVIMLSLKAPAQQQLFSSYTVRQGLTNNAINNIYQDAQGFIWICTWEGLNKYDGNKFLNFSTSTGLPHNVINDITENSRGELLVAMNNSMTGLIRQDRVIETALFPGITINHFAKDAKKGLIVMTDNSGLFTIRDDQIKKVDQRDTNTLFGLTRLSDQLFASVGDKYPITVYDQDLRQKIRIGPAPFTAQCILHDRSGNTWVGTSNGLKILTIENQPELIAPQPSIHRLLEKSSVSAIFEDSDSSIWFGTYSGLIRMGKDKAITVYTEKDGLPGNRITCIFRDREKNLWIGTYAGLAKMNVQPVATIAVPNNDPGLSIVLSVHPTSSNKLAVISLEAVYSYDPLNATFHQLQAFHFPPQAIAINNSKFFSYIYENKRYVYEPVNDRVELVSTGMPSRSIYSATENNNTLALATQDGVYIMFPGGKTARALPSLRITTVIWDKKGYVWAGSWSEGLYRLRIDSVNQTISAVENMTAKGSTPFIRSLLSDSKGNIWVGTRYEGIVIYSEDMKHDWQIKKLGPADGLLSGWIYTIAESGDGNIWVGTLSGMNKIIPAGKGYRIFNFSRIANFFASVTTIAFSPSGRLWCSSEKGLTSITDHGLEETEPLPVLLTRVTLGRSDSNYAYAIKGKPVSLRYSMNNGSFDFTSPSYLNETEMRYSYRLIGTGDTSWTAPSNVHSVQYPSLNPGTYRFQVRMLGWNGNYGPVTEFAFRIFPPWWKTWWFYLLVGLSLLGSSYAFYRYRIGQLLRVQKVRNNIATDLHDDIGSTLTNISILSQLTLNSLNNTGDAKKFVSRIRDEVQSSSESLDDIIWSVNSHHDSIPDTLARMRRYAGDLFDKTTVDCKLLFDEVEENARLSMEQRRDLFLVYKEILNNVRKHSGASLVTITVTSNNRELRLVVEDDGKGFDTSQATDRNGLKNIRIRTGKWNGRLLLESQAGKGTIITVHFPLIS